MQFRGRKVHSLPGKLFICGQYCRCVFQYVKEEKQVQVVGILLFRLLHYTQREKADDPWVQDEIEVSRRPDVVNTII